MSCSVSSSVYNVEYIQGTHYIFNNESLTVSAETPTSWSYSVTDSISHTVNRVSSTLYLTANIHVQSYNVASSDNGNGILIIEKNGSVIYSRSCASNASGITTAIDDQINYSVEPSDVIVLKISANGRTDAFRYYTIVTGTDITLIGKIN